MSKYSSSVTNLRNFIPNKSPITTTTSALLTTISPLPLHESVPIVLILSTIVVLCVCGNILVILSIFTFRPLRTVQNFFIVSLAVSDMLVAIIVMPFHIVKHILNRWIFGQIFCQIFVTSDVLLCTASILNLCAIALDRYWAISDPIQYARQRTIRRVLAMIIIVWVLSAAISIPPIIAGILGSDELKTFNGLQQCELSNNKVYVIYSACGSFYIPAIIMTAVYAQVFLETRKRFRERARAAAKLANATRTHKQNLSSTNNNNQKTSVTSSGVNPTNSSLKYSASNGSCIENLSTDDAEETLCSKRLPSSTSMQLNLPINIQRSELSTSQMSLSISMDENRTLSRISDTSVLNAETSIQLNNRYSIRDSVSDNGCTNQQHASVQTMKFFPKKRFTSREHSSKKTLFKGKSLAALMHERQKISLTRERRLSRTLGIIISVFLLCWLPFFVVYILAAFIEVSIYIKEPIPTLILWLGYVNSAVNPLIYTIFNVEFRTAFKRLLCPTMINKSSKRTQINRRNRK